MFFARSRSTAADLVTSAGSGAFARDPSIGVSSVSEIAGPYCALPNT